MPIISPILPYSTPNENPCQSSIVDTETLNTFIGGATADKNDDEQIYRPNIFTYNLS